MIPNITKGDRMAGLLVYLAGPGRYNDHVDPRVVAGDPTLTAWRTESALDRDGAFAVARHLERPRRAYGVERVWDGSVWHCSLAIKDVEGELSDEKWAAIAHDFADRMGLTSDDAPCRWVAVRHGASTNGHDHIHLVATRVADNGKIYDTYRDQPKSQRVARALERKHGLLRLESRTVNRGDRGYKPAEKARADRTASPEIDRTKLERTVRACAAASADEAEFVRRARGAGLRIRPRFAPGRKDVVVGYSVALRPPKGEKEVPFGGGRLAKDLTLPRLRADWPDTPEAASAAVAEWQAAHAGRRAVAPGRETSEPGPELWERHTVEVGELRERLREAPDDDPSLWAHVARDAAGAFAAWSNGTEESPGPLAATARTLASSAQLPAHMMRPRPAGLPSARGAAYLLATAVLGRGPSLQAMLLRELANLIKALHDAHQAMGEVQRAGQIAVAVRTQLPQVTAGLPLADAVRVADSEAETAARLAGQGQAPLKAPRTRPATETARPDRRTDGPGDKTIER